MKTKNFKLVNAGFPKTASKSCSEALRILGYNVADIAECYENFIDIWIQYIEGNATIEDVIAEYDKKQFNMNNDW